MLAVNTPCTLSSTGLSPIIFELLLYSPKEIVGGDDGESVSGKEEVDAGWRQILEPGV